jgi:hypothetical protein
MLQDLWAQTMEGLADRWGRQMRYGEPPDDPTALIAPGRTMTRADAYASLLAFADHIATHEEAAHQAEDVERNLGEEASEDLRTRLALTKAELQAARREILSVFEPVMQAGMTSGGAG